MFINVLWILIASALGFINAVIFTGGFKYRGMHITAMIPGRETKCNSIN
jgi:hypothetical protein